jgi:hypothetical protein
VSDKEDNQVDNPIIGSHPMLHLDDDDYIDDNLALAILDVVMDTPFNDSEGLDINFDLNESNIELDEVQDQSDPGGYQWPSTFSTESTFQAYGFDKP